MGSYSVGGGEPGGGGAFCRRAFCNKIWLLKPRPQGLLAIMKAEPVSTVVAGDREETGKSRHVGIRTTHALN